MPDLIRHPFALHTGIMPNQPCVYILASGRHGTLYVGVTGHLIERIHQHRSGVIDGFSKQYGVNRLVWFEHQPDFPTAIALEKKLKKWRREWKVRLIEQDNPFWEDRALSLGLLPLPPK
ncbi:GIY-YIG nuclease family protein [Sphingobium yanoikuyae]|uniref:GIY-YIG nuclease family protein n=1 Tax=Sphingobium yanoikuyae TaxID=13690 RepID=UPI0028B15769|nr:GIY-YIG nuclease family protein [Sphingobium yanoikuyae]